MPRYCPACNTVLTATENSRGRCSDCGASFAGDIAAVSPDAHRAAPIQPTSRTAGPISNTPRQSPAAKPLAVLLFLATAGSFFLPWGTFWSIYAGFDKGIGLCAHPGCQEQPTEFVEFRQLGRDNERVGYCKAHVVNAPQQISITRGKSVSVAVAMVMVFGPVIYLGWFVIAVGDVFRNEPRALVQVYLYALAGLLAINALSYGYWHYCHLDFRHSGW